MTATEDATDAQFRALFDSQYGAMTGLARLLGSDDPQDTAQEAFVRLHHAWPTLRDQAAAIGYLRATVMNLARNRARHLAVARRHVFVGGAGRGPGNGPALPSAEQQALTRSSHNTVVGAVRALPARQRMAIALRFWLDLPFDEIAVALGCPPATARSHVRRGLQRLSRVIEGEMP